MAISRMAEKTWIRVDTDGRAPCDASEIGCLQPACVRKTFFRPSLLQCSDPLVRSRIGADVTAATNAHPSPRLRPPASPAWTPRKRHRHAFVASHAEKASSGYATIQRNVPGRSPPHSGAGENCGIHPVSGVCNHDIQHPTTSAPWFGTILAFVSNHPRRVRLPLVTGARKHGKRQEKACLGEKFSRILACCLFGCEHLCRLGDVPRGASALTAPGGPPAREVWRAPHSSKVD